MENQFIVLCWKKIFRDEKGEWEVVSESKQGCTLEEAQEIMRYKMKYHNISEEKMRIIKVFEAATHETNQAA